MRTLLGMLAVVTAIFTSVPAWAFADCASGTAGQLRAMWKGAQTFGELIAAREKTGTDVYRLLARAAPIGAEVAKLSLASSAVVVINCAAIEEANAAAATMRIRFGDAIGEATRNVTADRVQAYYLRRLKSAAPDQTLLLSPQERQLWADALALAAQLQPSLAEAFRQLATDLNLPPPSIRG